MAQFRLLAPHFFNTVNGPAQFEKYAIIKSADHGSTFTCTALMEPLDDEARTMLQAECDRLRPSGINGSVIGFGPTQCLPL